MFLIKSKKNRRFARSLFVVEEVKAGDIVTPENVRCIRPGYGAHPKNYDLVMGGKFNKNIDKGTPLDMTSIDL